MISYVGAAADHLGSNNNAKKNEAKRNATIVAGHTRTFVVYTKTSIIIKKRAVLSELSAIGDSTPRIPWSKQEEQQQEATHHQRGQGFLPLVWHKHLKLLSVACRSIGVGYHGSFQHRPVFIRADVRSKRTSCATHYNAGHGEVLAQRARRSCSFVRSLLSSSSSCCQQTSKAFFLFFRRKTTRKGG